MLSSQLDTQLGNELGADWGLDVLVRVGETWLPKLVAVGGTSQRGSTCTGANRTKRGGSASGGAAGSGSGATDVPLLKLFEFLTASLCLYVIEEEGVAVLRRTASIYGSAPAPGSKG